MNKKIILFIVLILVFAFIAVSCSNIKKELESLKELDTITATISYKDVAKDSDFEKYKNSFPSEYAAPPDYEIEFEKDNYYLIKVVCTINNGSSKNLSYLYFESYKDSMLMYAAEAINVAPSYPMSPHSTESFDAYIYVDKSLDTEEKIKNELADTDFKFTAYLYDDSPLYSKQIDFQGTFNRWGNTEDGSLCFSVFLQKRRYSLKLYRLPA